MAKPNLSREKIVDAAIQYADEQGLNAVTLRGLAKRLRVHVTSLYNHIPTKDALYSEMMMALVAESNIPVGSLAWQEWVKLFATAIQALAHRHPGAFQLFQQGPARGERAMQSLESAIAAFRSDGFDEISTYCAIRTVNVAVLGLVLDDLGRDQRPVIRAELGQLPIDRFPHIHEILGAGDGADSFQFLTDALIDGLAAHPNYGRATTGHQGD